MNEILIFLHIAKTGGTTLGRILSRQFPVSAQMNTHVGETKSALGVWPTEAFGQAWHALDAERQSAVRHIAGHSLFGTHRVIGRPYSYVGMLRDPVDRVASSYYYIATQPGIPVSRDIAAGLDLPGYIRSHRGLDPHNYQTRILTGDEAFNAAWDRVGEVLASPMPRSALETAWTNVHEHFSVMGIMEQFDKSLMLMKLKFGWPASQLLYRQENVNAARPAVSSLDAATVAAIRVANELDCELYARASERLERACKPCEGLLAEMVERFRSIQASFRGRDMPDAAELDDNALLECERLDSVATRWAPESKAVIA